MRMFFWAVNQVVVMIVDEPSGLLIYKEQITCNFKNPLLEALDAIMRGKKYLHQHDTCARQP